MHNHPNGHSAWGFDKYRNASSKNLYQKFLKSSEPERYSPVAALIQYLTHIDFDWMIGLRPVTGAGAESGETVLKCRPTVYEQAFSFKIYTDTCLLRLKSFWNRSAGVWERNNSLDIHPNRKSGCISAKLMIPYSPPDVFIAACTSSDRGYGVGITEKTHEIHHCVQQVRRMEPEMLAWLCERACKRRAGKKIVAWNADMTVWKSMHTHNWHEEWDLTCWSLIWARERREKYYNIFISWDRVDWGG